MNRGSRSAVIQPTDDLRSRIREAALGVRLHLGPNALDLARRGEPVRLSGNEADLLTDAVIAAIGHEASAESPPLREQLEARDV